MPRELNSRVANNEGINNMNQWYAANMSNDVIGPFNTKADLLRILVAPSSKREAKGLYKVGRWYVGRESTLKRHGFMEAP